MMIIKAMKKMKWLILKERKELQEERKRKQLPSKNLAVNIWMNEFF